MGLLEEVRQETQSALDLLKTKEEEERISKSVEREKQLERARKDFNVYFKARVDEIKKTARLGYRCTDIDRPRFYENEYYSEEIFKLLSIELKKLGFSVIWNTREFQGSDESPVEQIVYIRVSW